MKKILGISAFYHDSAAALVIDGIVVAAAQEERFTRVKHTAIFPTQSIRYCLEFAGLSLDELDAVVFYDKPLLKFERLLETYYAFAPRGLLSFLKAIPVWLREKLLLKKQIYDGLKEIGSYDKKKLRLLFSEHHLSHAASAFYCSTFEEAAILTIDGVGEWSTASIGMGKGPEIRMLREMKFPHSVGLLYSAFTYYLGFTVNSGEYKLMGLAPYGNPDAEETARFEQLIRRRLVDIKEDGSIWLNQRYFRYATGLRMVPDRRWKALFGFPRRKRDSDILSHHCNLALAIQRITEEIVFKMAREAKRITGCSKLCLAGGVALNCVANGKLLRSGLFDDLYIQPAAGDAGGAPGAALAAHHLYFLEPRLASGAMPSVYLGPAFQEEAIEELICQVGGQARKFDDEEALCSFVAARIAEGQVVGWFQGRMEFGPRALGNRSILGDARHPEMQKKLNLKIKNREGFRPFAPAVLEEHAQDFFELDAPSPYMLLVAPIKGSRRKPLPGNYHDLSLWDQLYRERSDIPAVTHVDFSARVQTVSRAVNPRFWRLIHTFQQQTGYGLLVNTSFNVRGEPIVCTPLEAYQCYENTEMDLLVIGDFVFEKYYPLRR
ncbi:MAG: carbamoyltransferase [Lewinellaceae bacterium]|nr:carbamoyltransferase [Lewinellaceae bacterium]